MITVRNRQALRTGLLMLVAAIALMSLSACKASVQADPTLTPAPAERTESVTAGALNVRAEPSSSAKILGVLKKGQVVTILGRDNNWIRVRSHRDGLSGWVYGAYLTGFNIAPSQSTTTTTQPSQPQPVQQETQQTDNQSMDEISGSVTNEEPAPEPAPEPATERAPEPGAVQPVDENEIEGTPHGTII